MYKFNPIDINWIVQKIKNNEPFGMGSYGDGEFIAMAGNNFGDANAINETYTKEVAEKLKETFKPLPNYYYGTDENYINQQGVQKQIEKILNEVGRDSIEFHDGVVFDRAARLGDLHPLISEIQWHKVYILGNESHGYLNCFFSCLLEKIPQTNCEVVALELAESDRFISEGSITFISAGLWGSWLAYRLFQRNSKSTFIDVGSMWDVLLGTGAQRGWRQELYADKTKLKAHCFDNIFGKDWFKF